MDFPQPAHDPVTGREVARLMAPFGVPSGARVAVAVSGGADSLALALLLKVWGDANGVEVLALTVDHGLRADAAQEARQVGAWMAARGMAHHVLTWAQGPDAQSAVQARAREARYGLMSKWCRAHGVARLFAAHHQGDQAETFVMRLKRASTLHGLAAMAHMRDLGGGVVLCRPLLGVSKARLTATLLAQGQDWIEDPSNRNPSFERVRVRALIDALGQEGVSAERLAGAARGARAVSEALDRAVKAFEASSVQGRGDALHIDARALADMPQAVAERVLALNLTAVGGGVYPPSPDKVRRLARALGRPGFRARTLAGCVVRLGRDGVSICPEPPRRAVFKASGGPA